MNFKSFFYYTKSDWIAIIVLLILIGGAVAFFHYVGGGMSTTNTYTDQPTPNPSLKGRAYRSPERNFAALRPPPFREGGGKASF